MLNEVRSTVLRQGVIKFREGLNVVLGDDNAANSIGKSTALMIVDFVFGGDSFLYLNQDAIRELGEHSYQFRFDFDGEAYFFSRETITPNFVLRCDSDYRAVEEIDLRTYTEWLKSSYFPAKQGLSFRAFLGTYSRIWPKDNVSNVRHPLHAIPNQGARECISILIKIFDRFAEIEIAQAELYRKESERKALTQAVKFSIVEKIGARQYSKNQVGLEKILQEVDAIKFDLAKYALNIREVVDKDLLDLKRAKDALLSQVLRIKEKLQRTERNLNDCRYIRSEQFEALRDFSPSVNAERIASIETFHSSLAAILKKELVESAADLKAQQAGLNAALAEIDEQISARLKNYNNPTALIDRVTMLSEQWTKLRRQNEYFEKKIAIDGDYGLLSEELSKLKTQIAYEIQGSINAKIHEIVERVYGQNAKSPSLELGESSYSYQIVDDTGTGKAFANLVIFDLAIFELTDLPILIHDSPLFKNVENRAVASFIKEYERFSSQTFIALDEVYKYGEETAATLQRLSVVRLNNTGVLYVKDWRKK